MNERTLSHSLNSLDSLRGPALCLASLLFLPAAARAADEIPVEIHGKGWIQAGAIGHSTDTLGVDYNGNWFQSVTAQVSALAKIGSGWEGSLGIGIKQIQKGLSGASVAQGSPSSAARVQVGVEPYITEARFTYAYGGDMQASPFELTFGYFPFKYNENVRNLGLYLLRGTVYPGFVVSGFENEETIGIANVLGLDVHSTLGYFSNDLLLASETHIRPLFDYSLAYIGKFQPSSFFQVGAGVNFYRLIPINKELTTPRNPDVFSEPFSEPVSKYDRNQFYVDPATGDTTRFTFKGIKLDAFFSVDLKGLTGQGAMGDEDLKLYGEAAIIGVKDYKGIYDTLGQRIPMMLGFNLPVFRILDHLSLEVEYYGSPYRNDFGKLETNYSPIPVGNGTLGRTVKTDAAGNTVIEYGGKEYPNEAPYNVENMHKDDWKWSVHAAKTIKDHILISGQVANDHFHPGGNAYTDTYQDAFSTLKDWYVMTKVSYFF